MNKNLYIFLETTNDYLTIHRRIIHKFCTIDSWGLILNRAGTINRNQMFEKMICIEIVR